MLLAIYGSGGLGKEIFELATRYNEKYKRWTKIIFIDDIRDECILYGTQCIKFVSLLKNKEDYEVIIAVGEPSSREILYNKLKENCVKVATLIDPTAVISPHAKIGEGSVICEFSSIHNNVIIGNNVLIQPYSLIGHDIKVGNHTVLSTMCAPGGGSVIGNNVYIGMQSSIKEKLKVADGAIVSMGSVVMKDVEPNTTVFGIPARTTMRNDEGKVFK